MSYWYPQYWYYPQYSYPQYWYYPVQFYDYPYFGGHYDYKWFDRHMIPPHADYHHY